MVIFALFNFLLWSLFAIKMFRENELLKWLMHICLIFFLIFGITFAIKWYSLKYRHSGVVKAEEIFVRAGNSENSTVFFKLHDRTEFIILDREGDWYKISIQDGKRGWIKKDFCEVVYPSSSDI